MEDFEYRYKYIHEEQWRPLNLSVGNQSSTLHAIARILQPGCRVQHFGSISTQNFIVERAISAQYSFKK